MPLLSLALAAMPIELDAYLSKPDPSYRSSVRDAGNGATEIDLTSGTWQGVVWRHKILYRNPKKLAAKGTGILYITGDGPTAGDMTTLSLVAEGTGMPVAMLFKVPNQPLFGDLREDDLIAHTFQKYLETGDASWPLLFPMTKAALRAMDAVQEATKDTDNPIRRFVVCGASKRGWTTWMVGASGDKRVIGIAPMVIDNLNLTAQMPHQIATWGEYSPQIQDYTRRGLQAQLATPQGQKLAAMVDPYSYRERITMPALIIRGSNDPYWTVDALDQYEKGLKMPHWLLDVPNAGHDLNGGFMAAESIGAFARSLAGGPKLPRLAWGTKSAEGQEWVTLRTKGLKPKAFRIWVAKSDTLDFRPSEYRKMAELTFEKGVPDLIEEPIPFSKDANAAAFVELRFETGGRSFSLSSPSYVFKKK